MCDHTTTTRLQVSSSVSMQYQFGELINMEDNNLVEQASYQSPLISIWYKPRKTIRQIITNNPTHLVILLAVLAGIGQAIDRAASKSQGDRFSLWQLMVVCFIGGSTGGVFSLYIIGGLFRWTGSWFGGRASSEEIRAAIAWSSVPTIVSYLLWIPLIGVAGIEMFTSYTPNINSNPLLALFIFGVVIVQFVLAIWALILYIICISEVHQISGWKAIGTVISGGLVLVVPIFIIVVLANMITIGP